MTPHADHIIQHAQVEVQRQYRVFRETDPRVFREKAASVDADAASPGQTGAGAEVFKHLHQRLILPAEYFHLLHEEQHMGR